MSPLQVRVLLSTLAISWQKAQGGPKAARSAAPSPKGPEGPLGPKESPWALSLSAEGAIGGAFKARTKARANKNTDIPYTVEIN